MGLRTKFNLVMAGAFLVGLALAAGFFDRLANDEAKRQVVQEASLILRQATAVRAYTSGELGPLLEDQMAVRFLPHTVPSFAAQTVFRNVQRDFPDYAYKEAALNPTNPADRASDWEADLIGAFRRDDKLDRQVVQRDTPAGPVLNLAYPIRITDQACLTCHSVPSAAPASMVDLYGPSNGFGWKVGEVIGAQVVTVPMQVALGRARTMLTGFLASLAAVFLVMLVLLNMLLHVFIVRPVQRIEEAAKRVSGGDLDTPEYQPKGKDEVASLARSFNLMRRSLVSAMRMLEPV